MAITILAVSGCGYTTFATTTQSSTEEVTTQSSQDTSTQTTTNQTASSSNLTIYIASISASLRATWEYSLTEDGELLRDTYAFDNDCKYYNAKEEEIDFITFETIITQNYTENKKLTKCLLTTNGKKLASEAHLEN